ncbi:TonB-dependent receptor [Prosthecobacter sp. SYSU 5D2]|uniref:TonB-dependent receptor plug domain-containing protein n=1 Tax=Prosthecobacter sp. SYSU 5D2 TaxID=3134134 RepID=UPI0031FF2683
MEKTFFATSLLLLAGLLHLQAAEPAPAAPSLPLGAENAASQNNDPPVLPEVVVTATRSATEAIKVPSQVRQLSRVELQERQVRTLPEALKELPGVHVQKTANAQGSPYIRGFTGFRNLALIDGIRFNNSTFREGPNQYWNTIDSYAIDRIELVPGQGSVLYGSDAIGGTLNLFTKSSGFRDEAAGFFFHGLSAYRGATAEESNIGRQEFQFGEGGRWGLHLGASLKSFGDVHAAGLGDQPETGYDEWAYDMRLDVALDANWTLTAVHQQLRQNDAWRTHQTVKGVSWHGTTVGTDLKRAYDQERSLSYVRLEGQDLDNLLGFIDAASFTVSLQSANEYEHRIRTNRTDYSQVELRTLGFDLQFESQTPLGRFLYGVDYYRDDVSSGSQRYNVNGTLNSIGVQGPVGDDSSYDLLGAYLNYEVDLGSRFHLFLGARQTYAAADIGRYADPSTPQRVDSYDDSWSNFSASGRIVVDLDTKDQFKVFAGVSQGFRAPNLSDLSRLDTALSGETELPSPGLDPEQFINYEMGLKADTRHFSGSLSYFYTQIDDMIIRRPIGGNAAIKSNAGEGFIHGVELAGEVRFNDNWSVFGHVTWTEGEVDQFPRANDPTVRREPASRVVPWMGRAGIRWNSSNRRVWAELVSLSHSQYDNLTSGDKRDTQRVPADGNPSFNIVTLRGGWQITENIGVTLALENLLDEEYRYAGSGSNEPGFGLVAGATIRF